MHLLCFVAMPAGFLVIGILLIPIHPILLLVAALYVGLMSILKGRIRCPCCNEPIAMYRYNILGLRFLWPSCYVPRRCVHCGYDLAQKEAKRE